MAIIITPTEFRSSQRKYMDLAEQETVLIKRGSKYIELVVKHALITDSDIAKGITGEDLKKRMEEHINAFPDK